MYWCGDCGQHISELGRMSCAWQQHAVRGHHRQHCTRHSVAYWKWGCTAHCTPCHPAPNTRLADALHVRGQPNKPLHQPSLVTCRAGPGCVNSQVPWVPVCLGCMASAGTSVISSSEQKASDARKLDEPLDLHATVPYSLCALSHILDALHPSHAMSRNTKVRSHGHGTPQMHRGVT